MKTFGDLPEDRQRPRAVLEASLQNAQRRAVDVFEHEVEEAGGVDIHVEDPDHVARRARTVSAPSGLGFRNVSFVSTASW